MDRKKIAAVIAASAGGIVGAALLAVSPAMASPTPGTCASAGASPISTGPAAGGTACPTTASVSIASTTTITDNTAAITWATPASLPATEVAGPVNITVSTNDGSGATVYVQGFGGTTGASCGLENGTGGTIPFSGLKIGSNSAVTFTAATTPGTCPDGGTNPVWTDEAAPMGSTSYADNWQLLIPAGTPAGAFTSTLAYEVVGN